MAHQGSPISDLSSSSICEHLPQGIFVAESSGEAKWFFVFANTSYCELVSVLDYKIEGKLLEEVLKPSLAAFLTLQLQEALEANCPVELEGKIVIGSQLRVWKTTFSGPIRNELSTIVQLAGIAIDVTEQRRRENQLRESELKLKKLYDFINVGVFFATAHHIVNCNQSLVSSLNLSNQYEIIGKHFGELAPLMQPNGQDSLAMASQQIAKALRQGSAQFQWILQRGDGIELPVEVRLCSVSLGNRRLVCGVLQELHAQEEAEYATQQKEEEETVLLTAEFLGDLCHQLRTPLDGILGYANILSWNQHLSEQQKEGLSIIQSCGQELVRLLDQAVEVSKIETQDVEFSRNIIDLVQFVQNLKRRFEPYTRKRNQNFLVDIDPTLPTKVFGDPFRLQQVLSTLLINAIKHTQEGSITLSVLPNETGVRFKVQDTGKGMNPEEQRNLFLKMKHVKGQFEEEEEELGLPVSRKLVELMGGTLRLKSLQGKGSTFWFDLPMEKVLLTQTEEQTDAQAITGYIGSRRTLLSLATPDSLTMLDHWLSPLQFTLLAAQNFKGLLQRALQQLPSLIILDSALLGMESSQALQQIHSQASLEGVPILLLYDGYHTELPTGSYNNPLVDCLKKPFTLETLQLALQMSLNLEWTYAEQEEKQQSSTTDVEALLNDQATPKINSPWKDIVNVLLPLANEGDLEGLKTELNHFAKNSTQEIPFLVELRYLIGNFQMKQIRELLRTYL